jgi:hypothetical protein
VDQHVSVAQAAVDSEVVASKPGDEGMTNRSLIFAYLVFGPGGITVEGITRPMKISAWCDPGIQLGVQEEDSKKET